METNNAKERQALMLKVQQLSFALVEANLYLDSHPTCEHGIAYFKKHKAEFEKAKAEYEKSLVESEVEQDGEREQTNN
jgi:spore coat protein JB